MPNKTNNNRVPYCLVLAIFRDFTGRLFICMSGTTHILNHNHHK